MWGFKLKLSNIYLVKHILDLGYWLSKQDMNSGESLLALKTLVSECPKQIDMFMFPATWCINVLARFKQFVNVATMLSTPVFLSRASD